MKGTLKTLINKFIFVSFMLGAILLVYSRVAIPISHAEDETGQANFKNYYEIQKQGDTQTNVEITGQDGKYSFEGEYKAEPYIIGATFENMSVGGSTSSVWFYAKSSETDTGNYAKVDDSPIDLIFIFFGLIST